MELITDLLKNKQCTSISEMRNESSWLKADPEVILWLCQEPSSTAAVAYHAHFPVTSHPDNCSILPKWLPTVRSNSSSSFSQPWYQLSAVPALLLSVSCSENFTWLAVAPVNNSVKHVGFRKWLLFLQPHSHHLQGYHPASASGLLNKIPKPENFNRRNSYSTDLCTNFFKGKKTIFSHFY